MADRRRGLAEMIADAMREISVLVAAFGLLDKYMFDHGPSVVWTGEVLGVALFFFSLGATIELRRQ
jgi:hypothetical protein